MSLNMVITKQQQDETLTLSVSGRLDTTTAPQLETEIRAIGPDTTELILELGELEYISSAGLRVLLSAQKLMNRQGSMVLRHPAEMVMDVFEITGFADILTIVQ